MQDQRETIQSANVCLEGLCHDSPIHLVEFKAVIRYGFCDIRYNQGRGKCYRPRAILSFVIQCFKENYTKHTVAQSDITFRNYALRAPYIFASYSQTKSKIKQDYTLPACQAVEYTLQGILCMCRAFLPTGGPKKSSPLPSLRSSSDTGNYKAGKRKIITNFSKKKGIFVYPRSA